MTNSLQRFLEMGTAGAMGIQPVLDSKRREGEQLREATVSAATSEAEGIRSAGVAKSQEIGTVGKTVAGLIEKPKKAAREEAKRKQDLLTYEQKLKIKAKYDKELAGFTGTSSDKLRNAANQLSTSWGKSVTAFKADEKGISGLADDYKTTISKAKDSKLTDKLPETLQAFEDQFLGEIASSDAEIEELKKHPVFKGDTVLLEKAQTAILEKQVYDKKFGGSWGFGRKNPNDEQLIATYDAWLGDKEDSGANYIQFLEQLNDGQIDLVGA